MGARDTGWIQIYAENNQEAYDNFIQAYPIAENKSVHLPVMICQDGFITSHAVENIELMEDKDVKKFVGGKDIIFLANGSKPILMASVAFVFFFSLKRKSLKCIMNFKTVLNI